MIKLYTILLIFIAFVMQNINAQNTIDTDEHIPILGWYGVSPANNTVDRFVEQKESGITYNFTVYYSVEQLATALDAAEKAAIKMIIHCPELETTPEVIVERFKDHPALVGYYIKDEPGKDLFPKLGEWVRKIQAVDNEHFCYLNLLPNYASSEMLGTSTYRQYIKDFIKEVPLPFLSFDHYPITLDASGNRLIRPEWYDNLEIILEESQKAGKSFWAFALTTSHWTYPVPTPADIRLQVFSNLAYGAQGIQYFTYWTPDSSKDIDFRDGPIDNITKAKTGVYNIIKDMNQTIKSLSYVFLNAKVISVGHTGNNIPKGTRRLKLPKPIKSLNTEGDGAIVSWLQKGRDNFLVIVNRDIKNSMRVRLKGDNSLKRILKDRTSVSIEMGESRTVVQPGDILIYNWK